jgi:hypothetical protein
VFMMLQACLGVTIDGWKSQVRLTDPRLPIGVDRLDIEGIDLVGGAVDIRLRRSGDHTRARVLRHRSST